MNVVQRKTLLLFIVAILSIAVILTFGVSITLQTYASGIESIDNLTFTLITDNGGGQSYQVAIKSSAKPTAEIIIVPDTYNGLPVTAVANNGFMSCAKLQKVVLPTTVKKIGNNAFMNDAKLERVTLPSVESIGMNAFAMCPLLDRVFIPSTVQSVGANILRNNANRVYVQSAAEEVTTEWQSTWNSYFTGAIVYGADPQDVIAYREILDTLGENTIGYELSEYQMLSAPESDVVIYDYFRADENSEYLPVLNICSEAFTFSQVNSITFKSICELDSAAPTDKHTINIRSNAFLSFLGNEVIFEVNTVYNHPLDLQGEAISMFDGSDIVGSANGQSIKVFEESTIKSVTLSSNASVITDRMFYNCPYLESVRINGQAYDGTNRLDGIVSIGNEAFVSCVSMSNLTISSSVMNMGSCVFTAWGDGEATEQTLNIDFYDVPESWNSDWFGGNEHSVSINYKQPISVRIDLQDGSGTYQLVSVKPGISMPTINKFERNGYVFKGIYSGEDGTGYQYYTADCMVARQWVNGAPEILYIDWELELYTITYFNTLDIDNPNITQYTVLDEVNFLPLIRSGYDCNFNPIKIAKGTTGNLDVTINWILKDYSIRYDVDLKGCANTNPGFYTVNDEIIFSNLEHEGYDFVWSPSSISAGSTGAITVKGIWTPHKYDIIYSIEPDTIHDNPSTYTYGEQLVFLPATRDGYFVDWSIKSIPVGTIGTVNVKATYIEKTLDQCYNSGIYEIWTWSQLGQLRTQPSGGRGRTYKLMKELNSHYDWTPIEEFRGVLDGNGLSISGFRLDCSSGENIGFFAINYGTIKNLSLWTGYSVEENLSNVSVGSFAGLNFGTISNCKTGAAFNRPYYNCFAKGESYAGCFVGRNRGTIEYCRGGDWIRSSCNMGGVAGANYATIKECKLGSVELQLNYCDYNASMGGIVGIQYSGSVQNCSCSIFNRMDNYYSEKYKGMWENREIQPCAGTIIGYKKGGTVSGNSWSRTSASTTPDRQYSFLGGLSVITYKGGFLNLQVFTHDQTLYFRDEECGRIDA